MASSYALPNYAGLIWFMRVPIGPFFFFKVEGIYPSIKLVVLFFLTSFSLHKSSLITLPRTYFSCGNWISSCNLLFKKFFTLSPDDEFDNGAFSSPSDYYYSSSAGSVIIYLCCITTVFIRDFLCRKPGVFKSGTLYGRSGLLLIMDG